MAVGVLALKYTWCTAFIVCKAQMRNKKVRLLTEADGGTLQSVRIFFVFLSLSTPKKNTFWGNISHKPSNTLNKKCF